MQKPVRPILQQEFLAYALLVKTNPTPLSSDVLQAQTSALYDAILLSLPKAAANPVVLGGPNVAIQLAGAKINGLEILPGIPIMLSIDNERVLYEVEAPLVDSACTVPEAVPFVTWDVANIYLIALSETWLGVTLYKAAFV